MKLRSFLVIFLLCIGCLWCSRINPIQNKQVSDDDVILRKIITNFLGKYFIHDQISVSLIHLPCEKEQNPFQCEVLHNLFNDLAVAGFAYIALNKLFNTTHDNWNSVNLVLVEDNTALREILNEETVQPNHLHQKFFVVLTAIAWNHTSHLGEALQILWTNGLINSHVLIRGATNAWTLYTYLPYQNDCFTATPFKIESFTKSNFSKPMNLSMRQVYPQKLKNFNGCPLFIAVTPFAPIVYIDKTIDGRYYYKGYDPKIMDEISKDLNFEIVYNNLPLTETKLGMVVNNVTFKESSEKVIKGVANFTIGAYAMQVERNQILSPSDPYFYVESGFIYKEQHRHLSPMESVLTPFNAYVWLTLCVILYFAILMILMTKKFTRKWRHFVIGGRMNRTPIVNAWATGLGQPIQNPRIISGRLFGNFARTLAILWITMWFLVRCFYEGALYSNMQGYQHPSPYDTVEKVLASNCKIIVPSSLQGRATLHLDSNRIVVDNSTMLDLLRNYHDSEFNGVVYWSKHALMYFNAMNFPHRRLQFSKHQLKTGIYVFYFPKKSALKNIVNDRLRKYQQSGLSDVWYTQRVHHRIKNQRRSSQSALHFKNIFGIIQICSTMYLIAVIVFLLEIVSVIFPLVKDIIDYLNY